MGGLADSGHLPAAGLPPVEIADPRDPSHGDFACNFALTASKAAGKAPREVAELLREALLQGDDTIYESIEVAGPGFLNIRLKPAFVAAYVPAVLAAGVDIARSESENPLRMNVEYVSVNPNGPITIGSGRGAAFGSTLSNVLEAAGNTVHREYYINDGVNSEQMRQFAESVKAICEGRPVPDKGYKGDYVAEVAQRVMSDGAKPGVDLDWWQSTSQALMLAKQHDDLSSFGVEFDTWFSEQSLHNANMVEAEIAKVVAAGGADDRPIRHKLKLAKGGKIEDVEIEEQPVDEEEGETPADTLIPQPPLPPGTNIPQGEGGRTLWLRSTKFGDDMDRVLRRRDGRSTYISSDIAYHKDKFNRPENADKLITVLGPDHHGYIGRLTAVLAAVEMARDGHPRPTGDSEPLTEIEAKIYGSPEERDAAQAALAKARKELEVVIFQLVRFMKDGKPAPMRKRDGNIYALIDLIKEIGQHAKPSGTEEEQIEVGRDVARFFYLMRSHDTTFDFDLNLAEKQSDENPVFYVQYAHARICSILKRAEEAGMKAGDASALSDPREIALIKKVCDLPYEVRRCAEDYGVHRLTTYATELARAYHYFYDGCRVIEPKNPELSAARLSLCEATRTALRATFNLLGISAPERMDREAPSEEQVAAG